MKYAMLSVLALGVIGGIAETLPTTAKSYQPAEWAVDPFCFNSNFEILNARSVNPVFTNTAVQRGTVYASSPIGATLKLEDPGDTLSFSGQVVIAGDVNPAGNLQFRFGLYYQGASRTDTNWLGYTVGNLSGNGAESGLYVRNNPNVGIYSSGASDCAIRPKCDDVAYGPGWSTGTYNLALSVALLSNNVQRISWKLSGIPPNTYNYSGTYTNSSAQTCPPAFDQVGILVGAAMFSSAPEADPNCISFKDLNVTLSTNRKTP